MQVTSHINIRLYTLGCSCTWAYKRKWKYWKLKQHLPWAALPNMYWITCTLLLTSLWICSLSLPPL